ncbi:glycosyltransferase family 39 protein [Patescibacteria group bacterium]|nr:glycosyltransferase family 39 protein [Patescibacteria group bacterium]
MKTNKKIFLALFFVIILASFLRLYKLDQIPPSLSWDEVANGYNAYTIANWGKDEWGRTFPAYFKSFEDDKNPVHIYLTAIPVRIMGLTDFSTRLAPAIFGILNILVIFFLARALFREKMGESSSKVVGLIASFILAISPYALQFSRYNHEAVFALFFFMFGMLMFLKGLRDHPKFLLVAFLSFGIDLITYHSAKVIVPPMLGLLIILYIKQLWKIKKYFLLSLVAFGMVLSLFVFNPGLLGAARMKQSSISLDVIKKTNAYQKTHNEVLGRLELAGQRYQVYFSADYLFQKGDAIARHSTGVVGEFYKTDMAFLIIGLLSLLFLRSKASVILLAWALLAPVPASASGGLTETGHAARALYMMGSWHLIAALGYYRLIFISKKYWMIILLSIVILIALGGEFKNYINYYYSEYSKKDAIEWQYGMKQVAEYVKSNDGYFQVYMTDARNQPYIFFLYYLKTPLPKFLDSVTYNETQSRPSNLVSFFGKYYFGDWDPIESMPNPGVLYVVTPSQYDGLRHKNEFDVKKIVKYPNKVDAFYLVSYP